MLKPKVIGITTYNLNRDRDLFYVINSVYTENFMKIYAKYNISLVFLPPYKDFIKTYSEICDGFIFNGNDKHVNPALYGMERSKFIPESDICTVRCGFELELCKVILDKNKPFLGICGGMQVLNVCLGGTLTQYIPEEYNTEVNHSQSSAKRSFVHEVSVKNGTMLHNIVGNDRIVTNTSHMQAVKKPGNGLIINANCTKDGVPEGIELSGHKFCLGVQWHPEFNVKSSDFNIIEALARAVANS